LDQGDVQPQLRAPRPGGAQRRRAVAAALEGGAADGGWGAEQAGLQHGFGRDTAGVHFRRDEVEGIVLAELY
jgi:hypothetical protein